MQEYIFEYECYKSNREIHPSWCELCEKHTKDDVIKLMKKHLYEPGKYKLQLYAYNGPVYEKRGQLFFMGYIEWDNGRMAGSVYFDYYEDTFEGYDFKTEWPLLDTSSPLTNPTARFTVPRDGLLPSPKEFEISCEKAANRFIERLNKSVSFPLEIACDYPDVIFEVCYDGTPDEKLAADTLKVFEDYACKYNKRRDDGIHYVGDASDTDIPDKRSDAVYIHVDFGDCSIEVLARVIKAVGKSDLPIKEMILK
ncbi:MAG: hypothetical protein IJ408_06005 [Clostridia bacterium]|nr:hypothetical protein [Clostridia bacterium]